MTCISRPSPESLSSSWTSSRRQLSPLIAYSLEPLRNSVRLIVTSAYSMGSAPSLLSIVSCTSARPSGPRVEVPAKMTSSIFPPRRVFAPCSPMTQASASTTLDFPDPFGPTMQVTPGSKANVVGCAKDLNPLEGQALQVHGHARGSTRITASTLSSLPPAGRPETREAWVFLGTTSATRRDPSGAPTVPPCAPDAVAGPRNAGWSPSVVHDQAIRLGLNPHPRGEGPPLRSEMLRIHQRRTTCRTSSTS